MGKLNPFDWVARAVSKDTTREHLTAVHVANSRMEATDGHRVHLAPAGKLLDGFYRTDGARAPGPAFAFPPVEQILPLTDLVTPVKVHTQDLRWLIAADKKRYRFDLDVAREHERFKAAEEKRAYKPRYVQDPTPACVNLVSFVAHETCVNAHYLDDVIRGIKGEVALRCAEPKWVPKTRFLEAHWEFQPLRIDITGDLVAVIMPLRVK